MCDSINLTCLVPSPYQAMAWTESHRSITFAGCEKRSTIHPDSLKGGSFKFQVNVSMCKPPNGQGQTDNCLGFSTSCVVCVQPNHDCEASQERPPRHKQEAPHGVSREVVERLWGHF